MLVTDVVADLALNQVGCVCREARVLRQIEIRHGVEEPDVSGLDQIIEWLA